MNFFIKAGCFDMGSTNGKNDEKPTHKLCITKDFYMGKTEVTRAQWKKVMGTYSIHDFERNSQESVVMISWQDITEGANSFLSKLNNGGTHYRLSTEAEWEYAARAGTTATYHSGDDRTKLEEYAWFEGAGFIPHPVALKAPNQWGLYDMHGNVNELVQDWYRKDYYGNSPTNDPVLTEMYLIRRHVYRGGGWSDISANLRSAYRNNVSPGNAYSNIGFRLVRIL